MERLYKKVGNGGDFLVFGGVLVCASGAYERRRLATRFGRPGTVAHTIAMPSVPAYWERPRCGLCAYVGRVHFVYVEFNIIVW